MAKTAAKKKNPRDLTTKNAVASLGRDLGLHEEIKDLKKKLKDQLVISHGTATLAAKLAGELGEAHRKTDEMKDTVAALTNAVKEIEKRTNERLDAVESSINEHADSILALRAQGGSRDIES